MSAPAERAAERATLQREHEAALAAAYLARPLNPRSPLPPRPQVGGRVIDIVSHLARVCQVEYRPIIIDEESSPLEQVASALEGCHIRSRTVRLGERWWESNVPVLAVEDVAGLAIVMPGPFSAPILHRVGEAPVRVDAKIGQSISRQAIEVIRPLATPTLKLRELIRLSMKGMGRDLTVSITAAVAVGTISLAMPLATDIIFSQIVPTGDAGRLLAVAFALMLLTLAVGAFTYTRVYLFFRIGDATEMATGGAILDRLMRLPAHVLAQWPSAAVAGRVMVWPTLQSAQTHVNTGLISTIVVLLNGGLLIWLIPSLGAAAVIIGFILLVASWLIIRTERKRWLLEYESESALQVMTTDVLRGWIPLRASNGEMPAFARWARLYGHYRSAFNARWTLQFRVDLLVVALLGAMTVSFVVIAYRLPSGTIETGPFLAFLSAFGQFSLGLIGMIVTIRAFQAIAPSLERLAELIDVNIEATERSEDPGALEGTLEARRVSFRYADHLPWVLRDVTLQARPGEFIAIVGTSGSGKSTLLRLLLGFEEPRSGIIMYDNRDLAALNRTAVRRQFGVVLQSSLLLSGTIRENVTVSSGPLPDSRVWAILDLVSMGDTVRAMSGGLDTWIDENATLISGGQRQRLLLARALAHRPTYLFLDEATSALDNITQEALTRNIAELKVTRIVIAHRLSTIRHADHIIVLDGGRMVEEGTFAELTERGGLLAELITRQEL